MDEKRSINVRIIVDIPDEGYSKALVRRLERVFKEENARLRDRGCRAISCEIRRKRTHHIKEE